MSIAKYTIRCDAEGCMATVELPLSPPGGWLQVRSPLGNSTFVFDYCPIHAARADAAMGPR